MERKSTKITMICLILFLGLIQGLRSNSKVSVSVQNILDKQSASSGRSSIAKVSLYPEMPQANPPFMESHVRPVQSSNDLKPSSDYWTLRRLKRILGKDFDPEWMSVTQPQEDNPSPSFPYGYPKPNIDLIKSIDQLNFNLTNSYSNAIQPEYISLFKNWLLTKSTCQIQFNWEDLGELYWPKYIRRGVCESTASSCSWPPGMRCKLGGGKTVKILRWRCDQQSKDDVENEPRRLYRRDKPDNNQWDSFQRRKRQNLNFNERRQIRVKRLIRQLSVTKDGFHCRWTRYEHIINDECICGCS